jgi:signal peptidase I
VKLVLAVAVSVLAVWLLWALLAFQIVVSTHAEEPLLYAGDRVMVSRTSYGLRWPMERLFGYHRSNARLPQKGDLMAFNDPLSPTRTISERPLCIGTCVALPGDTVWLPWNGGKGARRSALRYPFVVPGRSVRIAVRPWNAKLLANTLHLHEGANVCFDCDTTLVVDGFTVSEATFTQDYIWVAQPNANGPYDSRTFGFVPMSHLIGRLKFVTLSHNPQESILKGYRWERLFLPLNR